MTAPVAVFGAALRRAERGEPAGLHLLGPDGVAVRALDAGAWHTRHRPGDGSLLARCPDGTVDLGCGPGRLAAALHASGRRVLGVDVSPQAVRYARRRGAPVMHRDLFHPLPGEGAWPGALLADGNIGIGGDPVRLLRRCRRLVGPAGTVLAEVDPPGAGTWHGPVALAGPGRVSAPFPWAFVAADDVAAIAARAALRLVETWTEAGRWFVRLTP
ncbi:methyltransferase domain-containing protein [Dactylosporangium matsuzakiense]|uniref:methyltransferase domain-containing protein n=1 Tax=Dactylosporangium matsuzakiense TaxID=53360 RepID=UPI0021C48F6E|nr:class I SAM-dependent methyltransferase [Dactylosporangium matsuzakiense]UWZ41177.1 class I SAM-dependent methyltransferase [Dactylosporangium matsuzakiense]